MWKKKSEEAGTCAELGNMQEYSGVLEPKMGQKAKMYSQTRAKHALLPRGGDLNLTSPFPKCKIAKKLSKNKKIKTR